MHNLYSIPPKTTRTANNPSRTHFTLLIPTCFFINPCGFIKSTLSHSFSHILSLPWLFNNRGNQFEDKIVEDCEKAGMALDPIPRSSRNWQRYWEGIKQKLTPMDNTNYKQNYLSNNLQQPLVTKDTSSTFISVDRRPQVLFDLE